MMDNKQIEELNELLKDHGDVLTSFYDEGHCYGMTKGVTIGAIGGLIGCLSMAVISKIRSRK